MGKFVLSFLVLGLSLPALAATKSSAKRAGSGKSAMQMEKVKPMQRPFKIMPYLGVASFKMTGVKFEGADVDVKNDQGVAVGAMIDYKIDHQLSAQAGIGYYQLGAYFKAVDFPVTMHANIDYLALHAGAKVFLNSPIFYFRGAFSPLINLHSTYETSAPGFSDKGKINNVRDLDILAQAGVGIEFPANPNVNLGAELTLNQGLLDMTTAGNGNVHNQGVLVTGFASM